MPWPRRKFDIIPPIRGLAVAALSVRVYHAMRTCHPHYILRMLNFRWFYSHWHWRHCFRMPLTEEPAPQYDPKKHKSSYSELSHALGQSSVRGIFTGETRKESIIHSRFILTSFYCDTGSYNHTRTRCQCSPGCFVGGLSELGLSCTRIYVPRWSNSEPSQAMHYPFLTESNILTHG